MALLGGMFFDRCWLHSLCLPDRKLHVAAILSAAPLNDILLVLGIAVLWVDQKIQPGYKDKGLGFTNGMDEKFS